MAHPFTFWYYCSPSGLVSKVNVDDVCSAVCPVIRLFFTVAVVKRDIAASSWKESQCQARPRLRQQCRTPPQALPYNGLACVHDAYMLRKHSFQTKALPVSHSYDSCPIQWSFVLLR